MKPLIPLLALALGLGAATTAIMIQAHRFDGNPPGVEAEHIVPVRPVELPTSVEASFAGTAKSLTLDDVLIVGEVKPPARAVRPRVRKVVEEEKEPPPKLVPAPCSDGEYRLLDERQGVRLMCPGGSL